MRLPGKTPVFVERALRASLSLETLAHIPLERTALDAPCARVDRGAHRRRRACAPCLGGRLARALRHEQARPRGGAKPTRRSRTGSKRRCATHRRGRPSKGWAREDSPNGSRGRAQRLRPPSKRAEADTLAEAPDGAEGAATPPAPRTIAEALGVAIDDGRTLLERNRTGTRRYRFESSLWHQKRRGPGDGCAVCAAGVIIARRLDTSDDEEAAPERFAPAWRAALRAIDRIRMHEWAEAFHLMHGAPRHRGAERFAARAPAPADGETWRDAATYTRWLDRAEHVLLPVIAVAEPDALEVR